MTKPDRYPFQSDAIDRIGVGLPIYLGFDPGLGKTRTALEAAAEQGAKSILVVCPASGLYVWEREAILWAPHLPFRIARDPVGLKRHDGITVVTYGALSQKEGTMADAIAEGPAFDFTVLDEAAALKNAGSNRTKAVFGRMLPKLGYILPMSGTPAPNHAGELYTVLKACWPSALADSKHRTMPQWQFEDLFCKVVLKRFGTGPSVRVIEGSKNLKELRRRIEGFMLRVRKAEVLTDLPPIRYDVVPVAVAAATIPLAGMDANLSDDDLLKLLAGASGDESLMRVRHILGTMKAVPAAEYIDDFMTNLDPGNKTLVFAHHRDVVAKLVELLADWSPVVITGAHNTAERAVAVDTFLHKSQCRMLIANIGAAGTGLTLVGPQCKCSDVFFVEASYSVGDNVQAAARVHRIGQREAVVARFLTAHGTIDDRIQAILARKAADFKALFD